MKIYNSKNLSIIKRGNSLIQKWKSSELTVEDLQTEFKTFLSFYEKIRPQSVLWLQENFKFQIPPSLYEWIENDIVKRQYETGLKNIVFTVSPDMLSHLSVISSFGKIQSLIQPVFFVDENQANVFLEKKATEKREFDYSVKKINNKAKIEIDIDFDLLPKVLSELENVKKDQQFIDENITKIKSLTPKEMEVFKLISNGYSSKEISIKLFVEVSTIASHRKNIIKKLNIKRPVDWFVISKAFNLLD